MTASRLRDTGARSPIDVHVGSRVRLRRQEVRMSQAKLAAALGITFQQLQKYERATNRISASRLYQLSRALKVPISFFFEDTEAEGRQTNPSYSRRWRRRRADFPLMVGCAVAHCVCFAAASGLGVGAGSSRGWIAGAMVATSFMALSASTPPRCGGSTRPLGRQQQRRGGR